VPPACRDPGPSLLCGRQPRDDQVLAKGKPPTKPLACVCEALKGAGETLGRPWRRFVRQPDRTLALPLLRRGTVGGRFQEGIPDTHRSIGRSLAPKSPRNKHVCQPPNPESPEDRNSG
jgi:hypothetical protein